MDTLHKDLCTFVTLFSEFFLERELFPTNFLDKNQITHFVFNNFFKETELLMR
jgi:hypothetical protein